MNNLFRAVGWDSLVSIKGLLGQESTAIYTVAAMPQWLSLIHISATVVFTYAPGSAITTLGDHVVVYSWGERQVYSRKKESLCRCV